ncbi:legumain [Trichonephila clavipes]|nr:legumain [Trichonephila clavipes]
MTDDIANNGENLRTGIVINHTNGNDVYKGVSKDYTGEDVTPKTFIAVLKGDEKTLAGVGSGKVKRRFLDNCRDLKGSLRSTRDEKIEEIQKLTELSKWNHCPGKENPADIISRGISVKELKDSELWWHGSPWLQQAEQFWPKFEKQNVSNLDPDLKSKFRDISQNEIILENREKLLSLDKFSSYLKLLRVTAFVFRFINNIRDTLKKSGALETEELKKSEESWIKEIQKENYVSEITDLEKAQKVSGCSKTRSLVPCLDDRKILRIKGRLDESELSLDEKHPILLPSNSKFTEPLILYEYKKTFIVG